MHPTWLGACCCCHHRLGPKSTFAVKLVEFLYEHIFLHSLPSFVSLLPSSTSSQRELFILGKNEFLWIFFAALRLYGKWNLPVWMLLSFHFIIPNHPQKLGGAVWTRSGRWFLVGIFLVENDLFLCWTGGEGSERFMFVTSPITLLLN